MYYILNANHPYLQFQLQGQQYYSSFLLSRTYPLSVIILEKTVEQSVAAVRMQWLDFCDSKGVPVPSEDHSISAAVYEQLLECAERFQRNLNSIGASVGTFSCLQDVASALQANKKM